MSPPRTAADAPAIRLYVLGPVDVRDPDRPPSPRTPLQPKRAAMLGWLALARPRGRQNRATLCALFWPELDDARARRALNQALHYLRQELGESSIERHGEEAVALADSVWCDAVAFEAALDAGRFEEALLLYRGDLLDAVRAGDLVEFERWADDERARLRARAADGAWTLAEQAAETDAESCLMWAQRALELGPQHDERSIRRLVALYDRCGDRAGAIRVFERHATRLREELEVEPDPATVALMQSIRARAVQHPSPTPTPTRAAPRVSGATPVESVATLASLPTAMRHPRRTVVRNFGIAALGVVLAAGTWAFLRPRPPQSGMVAVLPFSYSGAPDQAHLAAAAARMVAANLDGAKGLKSVDPGAIANAVGDDQAPMTRDRAEAIARRFGAAAFVIGDVAQVGDRMRIVARLQATDGWGSTQSAADGSAAQLFAMVDQLTASLLTGDASEEAGGDADVLRAAARTTTSLPALRAFLAGEADLHGGRFASAAEAFRRAVGADSSFALAYLRLSVAVNWLGGTGESGWAADRAMALRERLGPHERRHVEAWQRYLLGDVDEAGRLYREIVRTDSADIEGWLRLGEIAYHWGGMIGDGPSASRSRWEHVVALDKRNASALAHLARLAARERRRADFDSIATALEALDPGTEQRIELDVLRAFAFGTDAERTASRGAVLRLDWPVRTEFINELVSMSPDRSATSDMLIPTLFVNRSITNWEGGHLVIAASVHLARGQVARARTVLDTAKMLEPGRALEYETALAIAGVAGYSASLPRLRAELRRPGGKDLQYPMTRPWRLYLEGVSAVRMGDTVGAREAISQLLATRSAGGKDVSGFTARYARQVEAELRESRGDAAGALAALGPPSVSPDSRPRIWMYARIHERLLRARLLEKLARPREALLWYETVTDPTAYDLAYLPLALSERARIHRSIGDLEPAAALERRLQDLLGHADEGYQVAEKPQSPRAVTLK